MEGPGEGEKGEKRGRPGLGSLEGSISRYTAIHHLAVNLAKGGETKTNGELYIFPVPHIVQLKRLNSITQRGGRMGQPFVDPDRRFDVPLQIFVMSS